jgi:hypothetical protein
LLTHHRCSALTRRLRVAGCDAAATSLAFGLSVLSACAATGVNPSADGGQAQTNCQRVLGTETPCRGLLPLCEPPRPGGIVGRVPLLLAYSSCSPGRYSEPATVVSVVRQMTAGLVMLELENSRCDIILEVRANPENWPQWTWVEMGYIVDLSMDDSGDESRGGDSLWFVMREINTGTSLAIVYQYDIAKLSGVGIDASDDFGFELSSPECEKAEEDAEAGLLVHEFKLRVSSANTTSVLGPDEAVTLEAADGRPWRVETGALEYAYLHLVPPDAALFDVSWGGNVSFVAWPEPMQR